MRGLEFNNRGKNDQNNYTYPRAGVTMNVEFKDGKRYESYDVNAYELAVDGSGQPIKSPCCGADIIYSNGEYRCLDCENVLETSEIERRTCCKGVTHKKIDTSSIYAEKELRESWRDIKLGLSREGEAKRCLYSAMSCYRFIKLLDEDTVLVGLENVDTYSPKYHFVNENFKQPISDMIYTKLGKRYNVEFVGLGSRYGA